MIEAPLANGCTCNPAVMRQHQNHTPHTLSPIMYIINATAWKKKNAIPLLQVHFQPALVISSISADRAIKSQKSKVSADISPQRESEPVMSLFLMQDSCERLFLQTSTNAKPLFALFYSESRR